MYLSNGKRAWKVISNLFARPLLAPKYFINLLNKKSPIEMQLPWWSYDSISYVQKSNYKSCFEWGSGGSTLFLAKICKNVTTIENDHHWCGKLRKELQQNHLNNVTLKCQEIELCDQ